MTYNSKRTLTAMVLGAILSGAYVVFALGKHAPKSDDLKAWAAAMLVFIGIGIAGQIVIQILFHLAYAIGIAVKEQNCDDKEVERIINLSMKEDERDKLINLKSSRFGYICSGIGFVAALALWAFGCAAVFGLHILFGSVLIGSLIEGIANVFLHERGVR